MKIIYFDCFSGISGDMTIGALLNLGLPFEYLKEQLTKLNISGYQISQDIVERHKISAVKFDVKVSEDNKHRHLKDITEIINRSDLSDRVKEISCLTFEKLAEAEAKIHNSSADKIHFHEVGGLDAIIDIVGSAIGIEYFSPDSIFAGQITLGRGMTKSAHGAIPIPAPATLELLKGVPVKFADPEGERVTPTGAAILTTLIEYYKGRFEYPEFAVESIGMGAGSREYDDCPNLLRIMSGEARSNYMQDNIEILETNIDDMNPQIYDYLMVLLYKAGASEVYLTPVIMKKSRPGQILTVLCKKDLSGKISDIIFRETSTAGIRSRTESRLILERIEKKIKTEFGLIRVKLLKLKNEFKIQPEYEDCREAASKFNIPLKEIIDTVRRQAEVEEGHTDEH